MTFSMCHMSILIRGEEIVILNILHFLTVLDGNVWVWGVLQFFHTQSECCQRFVNIFQHIKQALSLVISIFGCLDQMLHAIIANLFYSKVVNNKDKRYQFPLMLP